MIRIRGDAPPVARASRVNQRIQAFAAGWVITLRMSVCIDRETRVPHDDSRSVAVDIHSGHFTDLLESIYRGPLFMVRSPLQTQPRRFSKSARISVIIDSED